MLSYGAQVSAYHASGISAEVAPTVDAYCTLFLHTGRCGHGPPQAGRRPGVTLWSPGVDRVLLSTCLKKGNTLTQANSYEGNPIGCASSIDLPRVGLPAKTA